jgi:hypothetical protein
LVLSQHLKDLWQIILLIFHTFIVHHYVIQIHQKKLSQKWLQHVIHQCEKYCRGVAQPKRYH